MNRSKWALLLAALLCIVQAVMPMTVFAFTAQTPTRVPEIGEAVTVYTKADMVLDFSSYTFSVMDSSGTEQSGGIHGLTNVMKIWVATTDQQQFTAYCLDMSRHYPPTISNTGEQSLYVKDSDKYDSTHAGIYHLLYRHRSRQKSFATHLALLKRMSILTHLL